MEFKGTPGPWTIERDENGVCEIINGDSYLIASVRRYFRLNNGKREGIDEIEKNANAAVIAKAPEMLEMLKRLTELLSDIECTLFKDNHFIAGWHLNGNIEPIMNFVNEMNMDSLTDAKNLIHEITNI